MANLREMVLDAPQASARTVPVEPAPAAAGGSQPDTGTSQPGARRVIAGPEAQAVNVLAVARGSILKRLVPLVIVAVVVVVLIVWLA